VRLELGSVDIGNTVEMAIEAITPAAMAKNIQIVSKLDADAIVRGDGPRLQQVVWNLVSNAVKFTPKNGRVEVRLCRVSSDVEIVFQDSGAGISAEALPYVFERFRQEDASVVRAFGGLGLGLSIARHLVELHGGTITASSPGKGKGSTFTVRIPLSPVATTAITRPAMNPQEHASRDIDAAKVAGMRVLVVEDEPDARELLAELLGSCGVKVSMASSVAEALAAFQRDRPEVILSDIGMPDEDGYALATKIRALPDDAGGNTPMIALTAFAGQQDRTRAIVGGFNAHVAKPVEPSELLDLLGTMRPRRG
jgi:CheY-like chemotaxis protein